VHLVSTDRARLVDVGHAVGLRESHLQYKPLKDPRTGQRREAWHWDLGGPVYPPPDPRLLDAPEARVADAIGAPVERSANDG
jgi:hypothetical protein